MWTLPVVLFACAFGTVSAIPVYYDQMPVEEFDRERMRDIFVVNVTLGNPAVTRNLTLDFSRYQSLLLGAKALRPQCIVNSRRGFDESRSTTFRVHEETTYAPDDIIGGRICGVFDGYGGPAKLILGTDDVTLGGTLRGAPFGVLTAYNGSWNEDLPSDGVLGMWPQPRDYDNAPSLVEALISARGKQDCRADLQKAGLCNTVSLYLPGDRVRGQIIGGVEFGPVSERCGTVQMAESDRGVWNFFVENATLGSKSTGPELADMGLFHSDDSHLLKMPHSQMRNFMDEIGAEWMTSTGARNDPYDVYMVRCETIPKLPPLTVNLRGGVKLQFPATEYIDPTPHKGSCDFGKCKNLCYVRVRDSSSGVPSDWALDNVVARKYCVVLNQETKKIGFAPILKN